MRSYFYYWVPGGNTLTICTKYKYDKEFNHEKAEKKDNLTPNGWKKKI